jgi:hypothetical protein
MLQQSELAKISIDFLAGHFEIMTIGTFCPQ